jgi:hypothetical protein
MEKVTVVFDEMREKRVAGAGAQAATEEEAAGLTH